MSRDAHDLDVLLVNVSLHMETTAHRSSLDLDVVEEIDAAVCAPLVNRLDGHVVAACEARGHADPGMLRIEVAVRIKRCLLDFVLSDVVDRLYAR